MTISICQSKLGFQFLGFLQKIVANFLSIEEDAEKLIDI